MSMAQARARWIRAASVLSTAAILVLASAVVAQDPTDPAASPSPEASGTVFESAAYDYSIALPPGWTAQAAALVWDGQSQIDSGGAYTDQFAGPQGEFMFMFGAPTTLSVADHAAQHQAWTAGWHGCPTTPDDARDATIDGRPARLHAFTCNGVQVFKLMAVGDGVSLLVNQIAPPGDVDALRTDLLERVVAMDWHPRSPASSAPVASPEASVAP